MHAELMGEIRRRLAEAALEPEVEVLVLAACRGDQALAGALAGVQATVDSEPATSVSVPAGVTLGRVVVEGFRGIGPAATLELPPGPGLTLVVGRNGSGKSSFADGIEAALTGTCARWQTDASRDRRGGWANLHHEGPVVVSVQLLMAGRGAVDWSRTWPRDQATTLGPGQLSVAGMGEPELQAWDEAMQTHRPLLATGELARLPDQRPTALFDTLARLLGLGSITAAVSRLSTARLERERAWRNTRTALPPLRRRLAALSDPRAAACKRALLGDNWDLDGVDEILVGAPPAAVVAPQGGAPTAPQVAAAVAAIRTAVGELASLVGTSAARAQQLSQLLEVALQASAESPDCPVCETPGALDGDWRERAASRIEQARAAARAATSAHTELDAAIDGARRLITPAPRWLDDAARALPADLVAAARSAWSAWASAPSDPMDLADHLERCHPDLLHATQALASAADQAKATLDAAWLPVARDLAQWAAGARVARAGHDSRRALTRAEAWLKDAGVALRQARFAPIAARSQAVWSALRQESHVQLGVLELTGKASANSRRVELPASVDGARAPALGVMSQGELNGLALSLFVPRATDPSSPFRFVIIDDPVQAMDPHKVDGLAQVLSGIAATHQVVVFTHDARLLEATRRMGVPCTVLEVLRRPGSAVEVRPALAPAQRYLRDAEALLAARDRLGQAVTVRVVTGACRHAIEAALTTHVRRTHLGRGDPHAAVEALLRDTQGLHPLAAVALLGDKRAAHDVNREVERRWGPAYSRLLDDLNAGSHGALDIGDDPAPRLLRLTRRLVDRILGLDHGS